jgi:hypothetical protein
VLVHHLRHGVFQQHDILIEGFDLALELDAIDQVDRDRDVFLAKRIQERVLEKLPFVAPCLPLGIAGFLLLRQCSKHHTTPIRQALRAVSSRQLPYLRLE